MSSTSSRPKRATIEDVANAAGVSVATVSRALRGLPNVAVSTRQRVADVAQGLNYRADPAASRLAAGRTQTVTVAVPTLNAWYFATVVAGAEAVCADAGYDFLVVTVSTPDDRRRLFDGESSIDRRTDALLLVDVPVTGAETTALDSRGLAVATIGSEHGSIPSVMIDDVAVGELAADHLIGLGHRRLGIIEGQQHFALSSDVTSNRRRGFVAKMDAAGLTLDDRLVIGGQFGVEGGREAIDQLLDRCSPPTAVFAMSDEMAFGALMALYDRGLEPGRDLSVVGVDDHEFARVVRLTTISQPVGDHGAYAARALISLMSGEPPDVLHRRPPVELIVRATTAPPPA